MPSSGLTIIVPPPLATKDDILRGKRGGLSNHNPEEQIRSTDEFEPITLIELGKKRKQRTIDENISDSESDPNIQTLPVAKTASDLNFSCKIDAVSEAEIVDAVLSINYSIDVLISNILAGVKEFKLSYYKLPPRETRNRLHDDTIPSNPDLDIPLLQYLLIDSPSLLSDDARDYVVDIILHNLIALLVHKYFFKGRHFFGVGSKTLHEYLESMFSKLVAGENSDLTAIQRWRSMTAKAVFQMNDRIDSQLNDELITELKRMLKFAFPLSPRSKKSKPESIYEAIIHGEQNSLVDVIRQARKISFMIQQVVSCQVSVAIANSTRDEDVIGTLSFGLQKILGPDNEILLIKTKVVTSAVLRCHIH